MQNNIDIDLNGIKLNVSDSQTDGIPVIFIHPFPFNKSVWQAQLAFLKSTCRVISFDIRGFGNSTMDITKSSIALFADDLIQLMDHLKIEKAVVCGLSMGGYILLNAVERYQNRFRGIILSNTQCTADSKEKQQGRYDTIKEIETKGLEDFSMKFMEKAFSENTFQQNKDLLENTRKIIVSNSPAAVTSGLSAMAQREETCSGLKNLNIPTLVITGRDDTIIPPTQAEFLAKNIIGAQLEIIEKAGHLANLEQAAKFNDLIQNFIVRL